MDTFRIILTSVLLLEIIYISFCIFEDSRSRKFKSLEQKLNSLKSLDAAKKNDKIEVSTERLDAWITFTSFAVFNDNTHINKCLCCPVFRQCLEAESKQRSCEDVIYRWLKGIDD